MNGLLDLKKKCLEFYGEFSFILIPIAKFILAFALLRTLGSSMGFVSALNHMVITLVLALICALLPLPVMVFITGMCVVWESYGVNLLTAGCMLILFFLLYTFFLRFSSGSAVALLITPLLCHMGIPALVPVACGLLAGPSAVISVCCGGILYAAMKGIIEQYEALQACGIKEILTVIRIFTDTILKDQETVLMLITFAAVLLMVYFIRRMSVNYAWHIAIVAGALAYAALTLMGGSLLEVETSVGTVLVNFLLSVLLGEVLCFLCFQMDYAGVQLLQFEDESCYYYVKAVPKMAAGEKQGKAKSKKSSSAVRTRKKDEEQKTEDDTEEEEPWTEPSGEDEELQNKLEETLINLQDR